MNPDDLDPIRAEVLHIQRMGDVGMACQAILNVLAWCDERDLPGAKLLDFDEETERVRYCIAHALGIAG